MNYLAHARLSFGNPELLTGNLISDFVKGKDQYAYPAHVFAGIRLHRLIDEFTDTHPEVREMKKVFRPAFRLYASPVVDVILDHLLANDKSEFPEESHLASFAQETYSILSASPLAMPSAFRDMFPFMQEQDWLFNYRLSEGLLKSLTGLQRRSSAMPAAVQAYGIFSAHSEMLRECYQRFYPDVKTFAARQMEQLLNA